MSPTVSSRSRTRPWGARKELRSLAAAVSSLLVVASSGGAPAAETREGIWISAAELAGLPIRGPAWERVLHYASLSTDRPDLSDQEDPANVRALAKALVYARTGEERYRDQVIAACRAAIGTEAGGRTLALGRNLAAFVIAADLVGLPPEEDARFRAWLETLSKLELQGQTLVSTHERRPNNWGTHAGASRMAAAVYLGDEKALERSARVFRGWLGERDAYAGFRFGDPSWQDDRRRPVAVNRLGARRDGESIDGVLPDDQRRGGPFRWPPPRENYVYEALQGALVQAVILSRAGYDPWQWGDRALLRAFSWLHTHAAYPAEGDDRWQPFLVNHYYGASFPTETPTRPGKNMGFTDWTHAAREPLAPAGADR